MLRIGLAAAVAALVGISLTGCSSALSSNSLSEQRQTLNFESDPSGAEIRTTQGQTCITPCELTVPSQEQPVTITKNDYVQQTVQVTVGPQPDHSFWQNPPPTLVPNPVHVALQPVPKPKPVHRAGRHKSASRAHTASVSGTHAAKTVPTQSAAPPPPTQSAASSPFPPPPPTQEHADQLLDQLKAERK